MDGRAAWQVAGNARLIDRARLAADNYVNALPPADRVMVVRADVLATPALLFESDRKKIHLAIDQTQPGAAPLNLQQALDFAAQAQKVQAQRPGEIVFIGAGRIPERAGRAAECAREFSLDRDRRPYRARRIAKSERASRRWTIPMPGRSSSPRRTMERWPVPFR